MSKIALDLKKFKHVKSDDHTTTLRHKDGHELTISKKALSPEFQEQLNALNKTNMYTGGAATAQKKTPAQVMQEAGYEPQTAKDPEAQAQKAQEYANDPSKLNVSQAMAGKESKAEGGKVEGYEKQRKYSNNYAEGGMQGAPASPYEMGLPCLNPNCKSHGKPHPNCKCYSGGERFAEGGKAEIKHVCEIEAKHYPDCEYYNEPIQTDDPNCYANNDAASSIRRGIDDVKKGRTKSLGSFAKYAEGTKDEPIQTHDSNCYKDGGEVDKQIPKTDTEGLENEAVQSAQASSDNPVEQQQYLDKEAGKIAEQAETDKQQEGAVPQQPSADQLLQNSTRQPQETQLPETSAQPLQVTAQNPDKVNDPIARLAFYRQAEKDDMANHNAEWEQDLRNGHITPETYSSLFAKKDTLGKIGTLFGMLVGGAGAGLSHQPSMIMQMMDKQIANDLAAQQNSKANAQNYLRLSQQHEMNRANVGNLNADTAIKSYTLAQTRMLQSSFHDLQKQVLSMPEGPAKETAKQNLAMIYSQVGQKINNLQDAASGAGAYYKMLGMDTAQGQSDLTPTQKQRRSQSIIGSSNPFSTAAQYDTEHTIPGVKGQTDLPVPSGTREQINAQNLLDSKVRDVLDYARKNVGTLDPSKIAKAKQKAEELTAFYNKSVDNLGMTQGRLGWLEEQIKKNPTSIIQQILGNNSRLEEIRDSNVNRRDLALKNMGNTIGQTQKQEEPQQSQPVLGKDGKKYIRQGNFMVPVK